MTSAVIEFRRAAYFRATRSSHPVRRGRPVVVPNSPPRSRISTPVSSCSSVGNGPAPTRVVYAFATPQTSSMSRGPTPAPTHAAPGDRVRRGDERIRAVVDVEQRALRALEQDDAVVVERAVGQRRRVGDELLQAMAEREVLVAHRLEVQPRVARERPQAQALRLERGHDLLLEDLLVEHVLHADPEARGLVGVAGPDPALRRADLELAELRLAGVVEHQVVGHDQVGVGRDLEPADVDAPRPQVVDLLGQHARVDHDAVADHARLAGVEDPARDEVELPRLAVAHDRVPGVVAALEADDHVRALGEQVDDLALPLVAPLGANDDDSRHVEEECCQATNRRASSP